MRLIARYLTAALLAVAMVALSLGLGTGQASAASVPIWGYATTNAANNPPTIPGPTLIVNAGQRVRVNLRNRLGNGQRTTLSIPGMDLPADLEGALDGGALKSYFFTPNRPGTYVYEAGMIDGLNPGDLDGPRQVAMGLSGVLIVRPADGTAYGTPESAYTDEAVLAYSEIDPAFHNDPANFRLQDFNPKYLLINGKAYPDTEVIGTTAGNTVLLRHANLGIRFHSMGVLGLRQTVIADDGGLLPTTSSLFAKTLGAGQTMDSLVTVPGGVADGTMYPLYDTAMRAHGPSGVNGMGGMLTFIAAGVASGDLVGPAVTVALAPPTTDGTTDIALDVTADDTTNGGSAITAADYSIDGGTPVAFTVAGTNVSESLGATLLGGDLLALGVGSHSVTVTATDAAGNTTTASGTFTVTAITPPSDTETPAVSGAAVTPALSNSTTTVALSATATDNVGVTGWSYTIGSSTTGFVVPSGTSVGLNADIDVSGLADGTYTVDVQASDAAGNFSGTSTTFTLDRTAPTVTGSTSPAAVAPGAGVALSVSFSDALSDIASASYTLDGGTTATSLSTAGGTVAVSTSGLALGDHTFTVTATDAAGNTGTADIAFTIADSLFADGFESGDTSGWSSVSGASRLTVSGAAAMGGSNNGLAAQFGN
ncbi:multicopper oxidase domain-containing protein, partial [Oscillochloris sp. ZM17-4]|uniref:multicopper oxidase domain-containing protein n=1 Tax=Oscillochloris sp. ZM17-4 TaxID=2866714 RepID=UPI001C732E43